LPRFGVERPVLALSGLFWRCVKVNKNSFLFWRWHFPFLALQVCSGAGFSFILALAAFFLALPLLQYLPGVSLTLTIILDAGSFGVAVTRRFAIRRKHLHGMATCKSPEN